MARIAERAVEVVVRRRPRHRPPGRHRDGVLRRRRRGPSGSSATGTDIAHLGPGEFFGELSVLDGRPRTAQVIADGPTTLPRPRHLGLRGGRRRAADGRAGRHARARAAPARPDRRAPALSDETAPDSRRCADARRRRRPRPVTSAHVPVQRHRGLDPPRGARRHRPLRRAPRAPSRAAARRPSRRAGGTEEGTEGDSFFVVFAVRSGGGRGRRRGAAGDRGGAMARGRRGPRPDGPPHRRAAAGRRLAHRARRQPGGAHRGGGARRPDPRLGRDPGPASRDRLPPDVRLRDLGTYRLRDLTAPERLAQVDADGLPTAFPPPRTSESRPEQPAHPADDVRRPPGRAGRGRGPARRPPGC